MRTRHPRPAAFVLLLTSLLALLLVSLTRPAKADDPPARAAIPEPLRPWIPWVLHDQEAATCPVIQGGAPHCTWPATLTLVLGDRGGTMTQEWRIDAKQFVPLPGDEKRWPENVRVDGKKAVVLAVAGKPSVELAPGTHKIEGTFTWDSPPESLRVPPETGLLSLTVRGKRIDLPARDASGEVFLQKASTQEEGDALEIAVHRRLEDDVPMRMTVRIQLSVSGKNREIVLGRALPPGFVPLMLDSQLPARVEPDSRLRIQARAGSHVIELTARSEGPVAVLERPVPDGPWRDGDEVWVFQARPELRVVEVEGVAAIDPQQTTLPDAWKKLPAYPMKLGTKLSFVEKRRGDADPPPDQLTLSRRMWIDFDGKGMTLSDHVTGTLSRSMRLEMQKPVTLGRVAIRGKDQFITQLGDPNKLGVEIRQGQLEVVADSRYQGDIARVPAVAWNHDFSHVSGKLNVPPGFRVLHASGVDEVPGTWLRHWTLLEIFLVLILALATARLFGVAWGGIALVTLILTVPESDAPKWIWAVMLGFEALVRVLPQGIAKKIFSVGRFGVAIILIVLAIPFLVRHVREGIYPALANPQEIESDQFSTAEFKEGGTGTRAKGEEGSMGNPAGQAVAPGAPPPVEAPVPPINDAPVTVVPEPKPANQAADKKASDKDVRLDEMAKAKPKTEVPQDISRKGWSSSYSGPRQQAQLNVDVYDPNAMVQTGPGLPSWTWTSLDLKWSGPVERGQELHLWLLGPAENLFLALLRAALIVALALRMMPFLERMIRWGKSLGGGGGTGSAGVAAALLVGASTLLVPSLARADVPDAPMLEELKNRLLAKPDCTPECGSIGRAAFDVRDRQLRGRLAIDAGGKVAVPLPGGASQWLPERVTVDGKAAAGLLLQGGNLYVALDPGSHEVVVEGTLPERESVQIPLPLKPRRVEVEAHGWKVDGVHEDGVADDSIQLTRIVTARAPGGPSGPAMEKNDLPPFVIVDRTLRIGLTWQVETRVVRASPLGPAIVLDVPLLPGESVTTADVRVVAGKVLVNLGGNARETTWKSVLDSKSPIRLVAPKGLPWVETWHLDLSPIWHAAFDGIPPVHPGPQRFSSMPEWRPWPGESVSFAITRPEGAVGQTLTVDESRLEVRPGLRSTDATLTLRVRSSRGGQHSIALPDAAILESLRIGGTAQPIRQEGRNVALPITPGAMQVVLTWREPRGMGVRYEVAPVDLHTPTVNANVKVSVSDARWVLFATGPRLGPAVLFWSLLLVLIVVALGLSRITFVPLGVGAWLLLAVGLSQIPIIAAAFVVAWLVALGARKRWPELSSGWFDLRQIALVLLSITALGILVVAVHQGLLGEPDMQIRGNGSSATELQWFADRAAGVLPQPAVISVPLLVYRLAMLAWALWLALSVLRWLKFGWGAFTTGGMWKEVPIARRPAGPMPQWQQQQQQQWQQQQWQQQQQRHQSGPQNTPTEGAPAAPTATDATGSTPQDPGKADPEDPKR